MCTTIALKCFLNTTSKCNHFQVLKIFLVWTFSMVILDLSQHHTFLAMFPIWGAMPGSRKNVGSSVKHFPSMTGLKCKQPADI